MNNQFWREIYDQVDTPVMIFRDDDGKAQLMFINKAVQHHLGYTAEEYVLESEHEGAVKACLEGLLVALAQESARDAEVALEGRDGRLVDFQATMTRFYSEAIKQWLHVVTLLPFVPGVETEEIEAEEVDRGEEPVGGGEFFFGSEQVGGTEPGLDLGMSYDRFMKVYLGRVLKECGGKIYGKGGAAERLKLKPTTLQSKLIKYGVER